MENLADRHPASTVIRALGYLERRLRAIPDTAALAAAVKAERATLKGVQNTFEEATLDRIAATGSVEWSDAMLDAAVIQLARATRVLTHAKTDDARYLALFPMAPSLAMAAVGGDAQNRFVEILLETLNSDDSLESLREHSAPITDRLARLTAVLTEREALYKAEETARRARDKAKRVAMRTYNRMFPQLQLMLESKTLVETFFLKIRRSRRTETIEDA